MSKKQMMFDDGALQIERCEEQDTWLYKLRGKSIIRDANESLLPVFIEGLDLADKSGYRLVIDFTSVIYMNSSSFAPVIKILEKARMNTSRLTVRYQKSQKWQEISFTAMTIFDTGDGRVSIEGSNDE